MFEQATEVVVGFNEQAGPFCAALGYMASGVAGAVTAYGLGKGAVRLCRRTPQAIPVADGELYKSYMAVLQRPEVLQDGGRRDIFWDRTHKGSRRLLTLGLTRKVSQSVCRLLNPKVSSQDRLEVYVSGPEKGRIEVIEFNERGNSTTTDVSERLTPIEVDVLIEQAKVVLRPVTGEIAKRIAYDEAVAAELAKAKKEREDAEFLARQRAKIGPLA